jgi:hypothetical protein
MMDSNEFGDEDSSSGQSSQVPKPQVPAIDENSGDFSIDQIAFMLTQALMFCQLPKWEEHYKEDFLTIILCTVANIKDDPALEQVKPMAG